MQKKNLLVRIVKQKKRGGPADVWSDKIYKSPYKREIKISRREKREEREKGKKRGKEKKKKNKTKQWNKFPAIVEKLTRGKKKKGTAFSGGKQEALRAAPCGYSAGLRRQSAGCGRCALLLGAAGKGKAWDVCCRARHGCIQTPRLTTAANGDPIMLTSKLRLINTSNATLYVLISSFVLVPLRPTHRKKKKIKKEENLESLQTPNSAFSRGLGLSKSSSAEKSRNPERAIACRSSFL